MALWPHGEAETTVFSAQWHGFLTRAGLPRCRRLPDLELTDPGLTDLGLPIRRG
jgi:hypothetical protein